MAEPPDALAILRVEPLRPLIAMPLAMAPVPPPFADVKKLPDLLTSIGLKVNLIDDPGMSLTLRANDEEAAKQVEQIIVNAINAAKAQALKETETLERSSDPIEQAMVRYMKRMNKLSSTLLLPDRKGAALRFAVKWGKGSVAMQMATVGILIAMLMPAVQAAREAARRAQSMNNMKQLMLAMHNYLSTMNRFPARANFDKQGKPLLSWRVHLLPYLDQQNLYKQFHLDEPWNSEHNKKLMRQMPSVFQNPSGKQQRGMTPYQAVCGKGLAFEGSKGRRIMEFADGTSNTIMLVETDDDHAVFWTKPDDWEYDADHPLAGLGHAHPGGFSAGFADGSVHFIRDTIDAKVFYALLTIAGGETLAPGSY